MNEKNPKNILYYGTYMSISTMMKMHGITNGEINEVFEDVYVYGREEFEYREVPKIRW